MKLQVSLRVSFWLLLAPALHAQGIVEWNAAAGDPPHVSVPAWTFEQFYPTICSDTTASIAAGVMTIDSTGVCTTDSHLYVQRFDVFTVAPPSVYFLEARCRVLLSNAPIPGPGTVRLQIGSGVRCPWIAEIGDGFVSLTSLAGEWGRVTMDTSSALHTYRLEGELATDLSRLYVDGQLVLSGGPTGSVCDFGPNPRQRCIFGHLYPTADGVSEWEFVRHNLGTGETVYCMGAHTLNSVGQVAALATTGSRVITANDLTLRASGLPGGSFGYFLNSLEHTAPTPLAIGQGVLCLGGGIGRLNRPGEILSATPAGMVDLAIDLNDLPSPQGAVAVLPGDTWHFQLWYRDQNPTVTSNTSSALRIVFE
ncbi:MAG: hypothetical protein P8M11_08770 [Planctomycetota bacterium]|nr:hypothetical protein [Planctomycetota bacterium]MDG1984647.1 hypothetical protein [Planctomycetota bacterium]